MTEYQHIRAATFLRRPNRFIAHCLLDGQEVVCHVKNTGRCRELLVPGATVYLEESDKPERRTKFDLVAVRKGERLINMDAQAPNRAVGEWLAGGGLFEDVTLVRPETAWGDSRFDFYLEHGGRRAFLEVKGVTLEQDGVAMFPDAPTERGVKHLRELGRAVAAGYEAYVLFVVQMEDALYFTPNRATHPAFADALAEAQASGVRLLCYTCRISPERMELDRPLDIRLEDVVPRG